jgi:glucose/arabinose dehydrogenase
VRHGSRSAWRARRAGRIGLVALLVAGCGGGAHTAAPALVAIGAGLRGPAGLSAAVYATGLKNVSAFALDARGRLWATTSAASKHDDDGVYEIAGASAAPVKVIAGIAGPLGLTWVGNTLYVTSLGRVEAFSGLHGTRFAHRRTILTEPAGHGWNDAIVPLRGGRLAMGISAACDHCVSRSIWSGTIVSFRPDGSDVRVFARGIRAPVGLAPAPGTSGLLVSMNQRDDLGARTTGDALAVVAEGQDRRFPACYDQGGPACAGVPKPLAVLDKHAAVGGVGVVTGQLAAAAGASALVAEWATGKVQRVALERSRGAVSPFLTGFTNPLALVATARAVFVGDWSTGRVYRIVEG